MDALESLLTLTGILASNFGSLLLKDHLDRKKAIKDRTFNNMDAVYHHKARVKTVLDDIQERLGADRVLECSFSNGDTTFSGYHLTKVSITGESTSPGTNEMANDIQLMPSVIFKRTLTSLHHAPLDYVVLDEAAENDELGVLNQSYGMNTLLLIKIRDQAQKWIGYLLVSFKETHHRISREEIVFTKAQVSRLGVLV